MSLLSPKLVFVKIVLTSTTTGFSLYIPDIDTGVYISLGHTLCPIVRFSRLLRSNRMVETTTKTFIERAQFFQSKNVLYNKFRSYRKQIKTHVLAFSFTCFDHIYYANFRVCVASIHRVVQDPLHNYYDARSNHQLRSI